MVESSPIVEGLGIQNIIWLPVQYSDGRTNHVTNNIQMMDY